MTAHNGGPTPTISMCERAGCYIWTAHSHPANTDKANVPTFADDESWRP